MVLGQELNIKNDLMKIEILLDMEEEYILATIFFTEILRRKVDFRYLFTSETSEKVRKSILQVRISM